MEFMRFLLRRNDENTFIKMFIYGGSLFLFIKSHK